MRSERIGHWTRMRHSRAQFSGLGSLVNAQSLAGFITITCGFEFSVHTPTCTLNCLRQVAHLTLARGEARRFVAAPLVAALLGFSLATDAAIEPNESRAGTRKDPKRQGECPVSNIIDLDHCNSALTFADLASTCVKANLRGSQELISDTKG